MLVILNTNLREVELVNVYCFLVREFDEGKFFLDVFEEKYVYMWRRECQEYFVG